MAPNEKEFVVLTQVKVKAPGYLEAAQRAREVLMSPECPTKLVVCLEDGGLFDRCVIDTISE